MTELIELDDSTSVRIQSLLAKPLRSMLGKKIPLRPYKFSLTYKDKLYQGIAENGDQCSWLPMSQDRGLKIIRNTGEHTLEELESNVRHIQSLNSPIFPEIYYVGKSEHYLVVEMERVHEDKRPLLQDQEAKYLPPGDRKFVSKNLSNSLADLNRCMEEFSKHQLLPEDEWYKNSNLIAGKIIDFHQFSRFTPRYILPSTVGKAETNEMYKKALLRYKARGDNKWKGKIYQGMRFDNGYVMEGYSSDNKEFDSYVKLNFTHINKAKDKSVLDLGCNEGFFSAQAAIHGAKKIEGYDLTPEDIALANDVKKITGYDQIKFSEGDVVKVLKKTGKHNLIIMNSVLHQIYKNMEGADEMLRTISQKTNYFAYETPVNHPLMNIPLSAIHARLSEFFKTVRLLYVYDAYSSGYRAIFICYSTF